MSPTNDSEAQIITLCDTPILYDSISSKISFFCKERKKPRGRPRGRGRPKGSRNLPKEIQVTVIIVRVPSIKMPVFFSQHRPERDRHLIKNNHPFILEVNSSILHYFFEIL